jgi:hypothetical protein
MTEQSDLGAALDELADMRDRLDRSLVAEESTRTRLHLSNNRCQRVVGLCEQAVRQLARAGHLDMAAELSAALERAIGGDQ